LFAVGLESWKKVFAVLTPEVGYSLSVSLDYLKILIVNPDLPFEIPLVLF